ncbi:hypothetical protein [uncultured Sphingomonas sp.]|uniref:hypothetical protein n=1 Tax=uncultured Sphingomonas sp. TaxID=158754 RepID=UPI0025E3CBB9|nr:hypothetical protein [uncultured Sphingomonas sp.]
MINDPLTATPDTPVNESQESKDASTFRVAFLALIFLSVIAYLFVLAAYLVARAWNGLKWDGLISLVHEAGPTNVFGLPIAAGAAFGIVTLFEHLSSSRKEAGEISFKIFGAEFSGPAGPTTLWLACFLTLLLGIKVASEIDAQKAEAAANRAPSAVVTTRH